MLNESTPRQPHVAEVTFEATPEVAEQVRARIEEVLRAFLGRRLIERVQVRMDEADEPLDPHNPFEWPLDIKWASS